MFYVPRRVIITFEHTHLMGNYTWKGKKNNVSIKSYGFCYGKLFNKSQENKDKFVNFNKQMEHLCKLPNIINLPDKYCDSELLTIIMFSIILAYY